MAKRPCWRLAVACLRCVCGPSPLPLRDSQFSQLHFAKFGPDFSPTFRWRRRLSWVRLKRNYGLPWGQQIDNRVVHLDFAACIFNNNNNNIIPNQETTSHVRPHSMHHMACRRLVDAEFLLRL